MSKGKPARGGKKHLVGDGLQVTIPVNEDNLWVEGDGCDIHLGTNSGHLRITGDGCAVHIDRNLGPVEYTGDGGSIVLGHETLDRTLVKYRGDGGEVRFATDGKPSPRWTTKIVTRVQGSKANRRNDRERRAPSGGVRININVCIKNKV